MRGRIVNCRTSELRPPAEAGFSTVSAALPAETRSEAGIDARTSVPLITTVARRCPFQRTTAPVSPEDPIILENFANLMARQERWDDAIAYLDRALAQMPDDMRTLALRTSILLRSGQREAGLAMLEQLEARPDIPRFRLAILYSNVNDVKKILDLLERSVERREDGVLGTRSPEMFKGMREHPRFVKLLESIGP